MTKVGIIGAGSWGTALALSALAAGCETLLWTRSQDHASDMQAQRENRKYLPDIALPDTLAVTADATPLGSCDALLLVTPAQALRPVMQTLGPDIPASIPLIVCAKGIERGSQMMMHEVLAEIMPDNPVGVLSGPSFAIDVAHGLPTAVTLAFTDTAMLQTWARHLSHKYFRIYSSDDVLGVEIGGAVKNVLAIACGICEGKQLGASTRAALLTRAFAELMRLATALGARSETLHGLSGLGDLLLTSTSAQSRNYSLGLELGQGRSLDDILKERHTVSEGVHTASVVAKMAQARHIDMPICQAVAAIVEKRSSPDAEIDRLLSRPQRDERD